MSFIQSTIKCKNCGNENNIATGTFGYGVPKDCDMCGLKTKRYDDVWYEVISDGWHADNSTNKFECKNKTKITL